MNQMLGGTNSMPCSLEWRLELVDSIWRPVASGLISPYEGESEWIAKTQPNWGGSLIGFILFESDVVKNTGRTTGAEYQESAFSM